MKRSVAEEGGKGGGKREKEYKGHEKLAEWGRYTK